MKNKFVTIAILFAFTVSLSGCFVNRDPYGRSSDRGKSFPHDEHKDDGKTKDDGKKKDDKSTH
ncbi:hypothetical protein [Mucilaginibacter jinjuensis]|uniref:Lipoprotein n=1 Tax=Mucilaginibacter jinjuensis TaxID=1176721 RepID=A0ABY7TAJ9_9SPHI|nr:hypothetical protein [Mucilaginibacter jinjuensis]WCT12981.1 hypothetical protein PQO05_03410 [Mucilaginibacter jinjuensis]